MPASLKRIALVIALVLTLAAAAPHLVAMQVSGLKIVVIEGEDAVNIIQQKTAVAPVVEVRDRNDLPIAGVPVTFTISGAKTATFAGGAQTVTVTTNAAGRAAATGFTPLSNGAVQVNVSATLQGQTATATITQSNFATAAQASQAGRAGSGETQAGAPAGGFPLKTVILLGAAAAGGYVAYDRYQDANSGTSCTAVRTGQDQIPATGGTFTATVEVTPVQDACRSIVVTTNVPWMTLSVGPQEQLLPQTLTFTFTFTVAVNTGPARTGMINIEFTDGTQTGTPVATFGVTQLAGTQGTFRGTISSVSGNTFSGDRVCNYTVALSSVIATVARLRTSVPQAEVSVLETQSAAPGCPASAIPSGRHTYVLQSGSVSGQAVVMRFLATAMNSALPALSFSGTLSNDNRTITGFLTWYRNGDASEVTAPITFAAVP